MKVYISGPISGIEANNAKAFAAAFVALAAAGHDPVSPIDIGRELERVLGREPTWEEYTRKDIKALMDCDAIYMLDGWQKSSGAIIEQYLASKIGIKRIEL